MVFNGSIPPLQGVRLGFESLLVHQLISGIWCKGHIVTVNTDAKELFDSVFSTKNKGVTVS